MAEGPPDHPRLERAKRRTNVCSTFKQPLVLAFLLLGSLSACETTAPSAGTSDAAIEASPTQPKPPTSATGRSTRGAGSELLTVSELSTLYGDVCVADIGSRTRTEQNLRELGFVREDRFGNQYYDGRRAVSFGFGRDDERDCTMLFKFDGDITNLRAAFASRFVGLPIAVFNGSPGNENALHVAALRGVFR